LKRDTYISLIILGALGLAVGAAIGAMLPSTEQEDRLQRPARDKTSATADTSTGSRVVTSEIGIVLDIILGGEYGFRQAPIKMSCE
jgi:hypothetical protein